jgi:CRP/FNR family transcriptional regulator, cyclic AMP receptor protein
VRHDIPAADAERLKRGEWFGSLPEALQAAILARSRVPRFARGDFLLREGEPGKGKYALLQGRTRHMRSVGEADEVLMHVGEAGLWFGEYPLLTGNLTVGSVSADAAVRVLFLPAVEFERRVDRAPRHRRHFARLLGERLALLWRHVAEANGLAPEQWLRARRLGRLQMKRLHDGSSEAATITMSQTELANMIGMSRQTLNVLLARLQARGTVEVGYRTIRLLS